MTEDNTQNGPSDDSGALYNKITDGPYVDWLATHDKTIAQQLAKLTAYANEHIPKFYDALYNHETMGDPEIEAIRAEQFRTLVDSVRPLIDQLPLGKLISELAATDAFRLGVDGFEHYLAKEIMLLGTVGALFHAANVAGFFPN